jgi:hypothetical protein
MDRIELFVSGIMFAIGVMFGFLPLIPSFRPLPRWIRLALHMVGGAFFAGAALTLGLAVAGSRISSHLHQLIFAHILVVFGMGILFLLIVSGEYMKALRDLPGVRKR